MNKVIKIILLIVIFSLVVFNSIILLPYIEKHIKVFPIEKIYILEEKAFDGNMSAVEYLFDYYTFKDEKKSKYWIKIWIKLLNEKKERDGKENIK